MSKAKIILHIDLNAFFVKCEEIKNPALIGKPTIIGHEGRGIKDLRKGTPGNQYIHIKVETPTKLSKEQKELLEKYRETLKKDDDGIFAKFKKKFAK